MARTKAQQAFQSKRAAMVAALASIGGEDGVLDRVRAGETLKDIADHVSRKSGTRIAASILGSWMNATPERKAALVQARKDSAPALVETAMSLLDEADHDREAIAKAKAQADIRTWLASKYDRQTFGNDAAQVNVQVSLGDMHLDALRQRTVPVVQAPAAVTDGTPDYEVVQD